ncbi:hypothetical protein [uncultured Aquimarina sp.]|uniref:hypothetical protein n=1 Tax=uncultured Aquimarina sp. TaxID=575652 RepID=UPI002603F79E|nr:hypothetical protein [uncultured Aquimarina sp.]
MKTKNLFLIVFLTISLGYCYGQDTVKPSITSSELLVKDVNLTVDDLLNNGEVKKAAAHIKDKKTYCQEVADVKLCEAGLNFTTGYLYQQASLKDNQNSRAYQKRAIVYYEKVLTSYPNNKAALSNFIQLIAVQDIDPSIIKKLELMAKKYPAERINIYVQIGDMYKDDNNLQKACDYYKKAYKEDPFSEKACGAMVALYTKYEFSCVMRKDIRQLALDCQEIDLPNYSEELLRKELILYFNNKEYKKALESLVFWSYIMSNNNWLSSSKVLRLKTKLFPKKQIRSRAENPIYNALDELQDLIEVVQVEDTNSIKFWKGYSPKIYSYGESSKIEPKSVFYKIMHAKGVKENFKGNVENAEKFWEVILKETRNDDKALFTVVASDMAQLYNNNQRLDPSDKKLNELIIRLFDMKGAAYGENDLRMIRKYHITLGSIFYSKKKWDGAGFANARFQLSNAIDNRLGPIVNPKLRRMLGDVYHELNQDKNAINSYKESVQDYLSFDLIKDADMLMNDIKKKYNISMNSNQKKDLEGIQMIIDWRKEFKNPKNKLLKNEVTVMDYLAKISKAEKDANKVLSKEFVKLQFFKGLSDLGALVSENRKIDKQIILANALEKIDRIYQLSSPTDFNRIKKIKISLEESVEQPKRLEKTQMNKKANLSYNSGSKSGFKTYNVTALNKEIIVPNQLFKLNDVLTNHYTSDSLKNKATIELKGGKFRVKN